MRKLTAIVLTLSLAMISLQGCYGKMALTKKVYALNGDVHDKYVRNIVTWAFIIVPVYGVSALADFVLFNTIEFWSGKNPIAQGEKDFKFASSDGESFQVHARKSGQTLNYQISRYQGATFRDTLAINWDLKTGNSTATLSSKSGSTAFAAVRGNDGVEVTRYDRGTPGLAPSVVAQLR